MHGVLLRNRDFILSLIIIATLTFFAKYLTSFTVFKHLGFSLLIVAILLGMIITNIFKLKLPNRYDKGLVFCTKTLLRFAIVLYGFRLTFNDILDVGINGVIVSIIIVASTFILGYIIGVKFLKLDKEITMLTSAGSAICGAAAVLATEAVLKNKAYKSTIAVSTVVLFGTISMFLYPYLYNAQIVEFLPKDMAIYIGGTLHEVAHVVGASNTLENEVIENNAIIVKMLRVMLLAPFLLVLSFYLVKLGNKSEKSKIAIPWFAVFFILVTVLNSFISLDKEVLSMINEVDTFLLAMAMMALGLKTDFKNFKQAGLKPLILASFLFLWLIFAGYTLVSFL